MKKYFKSFIYLIIGILFLLFVKVALSIKSSYLKGDLIDFAVVADISALKKMIPIFILIVISSIIFAYLCAIAKSQFRQKVMKSIRDDLLKKVFSLKRKNLRQLDKSQFISQYSNHLAVIENNLLLVGFNALEYIITITFTVIALFRINSKIALVALIVYSLPIILTKTFQNKLSSAQKAVQDENKNHITYFLKNIKGMEAIKNYNIENQILRSYDKSLSNLRANEAKRENVRANTNGVSSVSSDFTMGVMTVYCLYHILHGIISVGEFVTIFSLCAMIQSPMYWLARSLEQVLSSRPAIESINKILNKEEEEEKEFAKPANDNCALKLQNISFSYGEDQIFNNLSLDIRENEKIIIYGESGSGKTSLIDLIMQYIEADRGVIYSSSSIKEKVYAKQNDHIFAMSLQENIFNSSEESVEQILQSLKINYLQNKIIEKNGNNLSGGERKRISLARSLSQEAKLLIFDEPLANIDEKNINKIVQLILNIENKTMIIISHQFNKELINAVDHIYKLENKQLREMNRCEFMQEMLREKQKLKSFY